MFRILQSYQSHAAQNKRYLRNRKTQTMAFKYYSLVRNSRQVKHQIPFKT